MLQKIDQTVLPIAVLYSHKSLNAHFNYIMQDKLQFFQR